MNQKTLKYLISKREKWVQSSKENNFDFDSVLSGIYNDPSHFIYEILQNAEDSGASNINFDLKEDALIISHNGRQFNFDDVNGISGVGISTKKDDINAIGKFGVGFKSVFAVTKTPIIHSGKFNFKIVDFVVPEEINSNGTEETVIILEFNHPKRSKKEAFAIIKNKLENLDLKTILFLKNIKEIKWTINDVFGYYFKVSNLIKNAKGVFTTSIIFETNTGKKEEKYIVLQKPVLFGKKEVKIEIAYRLSDDPKKKKNVVKERNSKLIVFFPTEKVTYLDFLIQGPYKTTPNRENIPLNDHQNQILIDETGNLIADSITTMKELGFLNVSFLEVLPIDPNNTSEIIYSAIFNKVKERLLSDEPLLPSLARTFTSYKNCLLARGKELTEILDSDDLKILFNKNSWLDSGITIDKTRELHDYLTNILDIKEVDFENFAVSIKKEFIKRKSDEWLIEFYGKLLNQRSLWAKSNRYFRSDGILRRKPILRLSNNQHIEPCDNNDNIQVYIPFEKKSKFRTIKKALIENPIALKFLQELGLSKPDIFAEITEFIIPKYSKDEFTINNDEYYDDIETILELLNQKDGDKSEEIFSQLKELSIVKCKESNSENQFLVAPIEAYFTTKELLEYFNNYEKTYLVSDEYDKKLPGKKDSLFLLFSKLGCKDKPRRILFNSTLTQDEKLILRKKSYESRITRENYTNDYDLEGLDNLLEKITIEKSIILWRFLLKTLSSLEKWEKKDFFNGEYCWNYYSAYHQKFEAKFLKTLKSRKWVYDNDGNLCCTNELSLSLLPDEYLKDDENVFLLSEMLGFQDDEITQLEKKKGKKVLLLDADELEEYNSWKESRVNNQGLTEESVGEEWTPEVEPEDVSAAAEIVDPRIVITTDLRGQRPGENDDDENSNENEKDKRSEADKKLLKKKFDDIGKWGERFVFKHLQEEYKKAINVEIIWLNTNGNVGKGYDFSIVAEGKEIEYIEVKSKIDNSPQFIKITGKQWEFARKLYDEKEGDKYKVYVVSNAGTDDAMIGIYINPVKLWKDGKLYAHPVNIRL